MIFEEQNDFLKTVLLFERLARLCKNGKFPRPDPNTNNPVTEDRLLKAARIHVGLELKLSPRASTKR